MTVGDWTGWLGTALLLLGGAGWGQAVGRRGVTLPVLLLTALASAAGLALTGQAFLRGHDLPLVLGAVGALAGAALLVFSRRE